MSLTGKFSMKGDGVGLPPIPTAMARRTEMDSAGQGSAKPGSQYRTNDGLAGVRAPTKSDSLIGRNIRDLRRAKVITQQGLASMVGVTGAQLHRYETGTTRVAASRLIAIAEALGVPADALMGSAGPDSQPALRLAAVRPFLSDGDDIVELIHVFGRIADAKNRSAVIAVARMLAAKDVTGHQGLDGN